MLSNIRKKLPMLVEDSVGGFRWISERNLFWRVVSAWLGYIEKKCKEFYFFVRNPKVLVLVGMYSKKV